jgi:hypothetical protein
VRELGAGNETGGLIVDIGDHQVIGLVLQKPARGFEVDRMIE